LSEPARLRRSLNLFETTLGGIGIILGAGIYALIGTVAAEAGNGTWLSFLIAALLAAVIGLCYAELASMFPRAGADYEYTRQAFGGRPAFVVGWLIVIGNVLAAAAVALGFGGYLEALTGADKTLSALVALSVATLIGFYGIEQTVRITIIGSLVELSGLVFVIVVGIPDLPDASLTDLNRGAGGVIQGAALVMFAFLGFSQIATLAEEAEDASRVVPKAMILSIATTGLLYVLVAMSALAVLGWERLSSSDAPLATVAEEVFGDRASDIIALIALFATANTMLLLLVSASRLIYGMASTDALPRFLAWVHPKARTPVNAISLSLALAAAFALTGELSFVAGATNFAVFVGFAAVCASLFVLRYSRPEAPRPYRAPLNILGFPLVAPIGLLLTLVMMASLERDVLLLGAGLFLSGVIAMQVLSLWKPKD
jgi:APA family basic amino acid/polyamine antiporter